MARHGIRRVTARGRNDGRQLDLPSSVPPDLSGLHGLLPPARGTGGWHHAHERDVALPRDGRVHRSLSDCAGPADAAYSPGGGPKTLQIPYFFLDASLLFAGFLFPPRGAGEGLGPLSVGFPPPLTPPPSPAFPPATREPNRS